MIDQAIEFLAGIGLDLRGISTFWLMVQLGILFGAMLAAIIINRLIREPVHNTLRKIKGQPALLRILLTFYERLFWVVLAVNLWIGYSVLSSITWPSHSYFIRAAAGLVAAWVVISIASRLLRNRFFARIIAVIAWVITALFVFGILPQVVGWLDSVAFNMGDIRISLLKVIQSTFLLVVLVWLALFCSNYLSGQIDRNEDLSPSLKVLVRKLLRILLVGLAVLVSLTAVGIDLTALAVFSGALGIGIGLGLQKIVSNFVSGIILLLDKSIKPGDVIEIETVSGTTYGWVQTLGARYTSLRTRDGTETLVPNENFIDQSVTNWSFSDSVVRKRIPVGVSYDTDVEQAMTLCTEAVGRVERVLKKPPPKVLVKGFGDNSVDLEVRFWIDDPDEGVANISSDIYLEIWKSFKKNKIEIPFPQRDLHIRSSEVIFPKSDLKNAK